MPYTEEFLARGRAAELHRAAQRARQVRLLRARRRAEVAARRAQRLSERAEAAARALEPADRTLLAWAP